MDEYVYSPSFFWLVVDHVSTTLYWANPVLMLLASAVWVRKKFEIPALVNAFGAILCLSSQLSRWLVDEMVSVHLGYRHPSIEENPFLFFVYIHGFDIGLGLFIASLACHFWTQVHE